MKNEKKISGDAVMVTNQFFVAFECQCLRVFSVECAYILPDGAVLCEECFEVYKNPKPPLTL